jgi:hypothetical protein
MSGPRLGIPSALRPAHSLRSWLTLGIVAGTSLCCGDAKAALEQVFSRAALNGSEFIDWGDLGNPLDLVPKPFSINTNLGTAISGTMLAAGPFERTDQGNAWGGDFSSGDKLLFTNTPGSFDNPITLEFPTGFAGVGTQIQVDNIGPYTARAVAYGVGNVVMGSFEVSGFSGSSSAGTAPFIGLRSTETAEPIVKVDFSISAVASNKSSFAINQVDFSTQFDPPVNTVPAPLPFLGVGAGFAYSRRLKSRIRASKQS